MSHLLKKYPFSKTDIDLPEVQAFDCGGNPWDLEVSGWIKSRSGNNSVLEDMEHFNIEVWLYRHDNGNLVGYSSLGKTTYTWPVSGKKKQIVSVLPFIGLRKQFQGEPKDAARKDDKYAYQILDDLLVSAAEKVLSDGRYPLIVLSADEKNTRALNYYAYREFIDLRIPRIDKQTGVTYIRMGRPLDDLVAQLRAQPQEDAGQGGLESAEEGAHVAGFTELSLPVCILAIPPYHRDNLHIGRHHHRADLLTSWPTRPHSLRKEDPDHASTLSIRGETGNPRRRHRPADARPTRQPGQHARPGRPRRPGRRRQRSSPAAPTCAA